MLTPTECVVINNIVEVIHKDNKKAGWWTAPDGSSLKETPHIVPLKLALVHSEISEALEAHRKNLKDDKLPHRSGLEVELADACIRIFDLAGAYGLDLGGAIDEKLQFNKHRQDHSKQARSSTNGKAY
jgi:NTP pyrophosphatase (non-canonical NTP hydrolase)